MIKIVDLMVYKWLFAATFHKLTIWSLDATAILIEKLLFLAVSLFNTWIVLLFWYLDWEVSILILHRLVVGSKFQLFLHILILLHIVSHLLDVILR